MKRKTRFSLMLLFTGYLYWGCNGENIPDCFQNAGDITRVEIALPPFQKITVFEGVELVLKSGPVQEVVIETGEYLINEVSATVEGDRLILRNTNNCNLFRAYGITKAFVTSPDLNEVRSGTGLPVRSEEVLQFQNLALISESFNNPETETTDGSFNLEVNVESIQLVANGIAYFQIRGTAERFSVNIAAGDSRVEAEGLLASEVGVNHRGSNDVLVNPQQRLTGVIRGTGDVLSFNRPDSVAVEEVYRGKLIFVD